MPKYTYDWHDKCWRWDVVRWSEPVNGVRIGTTVGKFDHEEDAKELCDFYNDMEDPTLWSDIGCEFDPKMI
jgi:hypothetical protein